jgi:hypothetical protein
MTAVFYIITISPVRPDGTRGVPITVNRFVDGDWSPHECFSEAREHAMQLWSRRYGGQISHFVVDFYHVAPLDASPANTPSSNA